MVDGNGDGNAGELWRTLATFLMTRTWERPQRPSLTCVGA